MHFSICIGFLVSAVSENNESWIEGLLVVSHSIMQLFFVEKEYAHCLQLLHYFTSVNFSNKFIQDIKNSLFHVTYPQLIKSPYTIPMFILFLMMFPFNEDTMKLTRRFKPLV